MTLCDLLKQPGKKAPRHPIHVCFMIQRLLRGGTETQLVALINHLDRARVRPFLCLLDGEDELSRSLEPRRCCVMRLGVRSLRDPRNLAKAVRLLRFFWANRIDVLQTYFADSTYFGVPLARAAGIPRIVKTRFNLGHWLTPVHQSLGRLFTRFADATVTNCQACSAAVVRDEGAPPGAITVITNGVDLGPFSAIPDLAMDSGKTGSGKTCRVGMVANLRPVKDPLTFLHAARRLADEFPDMTFAIAGDGEMRRTLDAIVSEWGLSSRVRFLGPVTEIPTFLGGIDIAVLCSRAEGLPNSILEYMAAGRAIVSTNVGGVPQLINNGREGLLVPPGDPEALANAIAALARDPHLAQRLGMAARRHVRAGFSMEARARKFEAFYQDLLLKRSPAPEDAWLAPL